jgi:steroid 5-alpha reductase family enzyme
MDLVTISFAPTMLELILICLLACCGVMFFAWRWSKKIGNAGVVDIFWAFNFPLIAFLLFLMAEGWLPRRIVLACMVIAAGLRLGLHLGIRVISHLDEEEGRYKQLRKEWAPRADNKFCWFFQVQAVSNVLLGIPFFIVMVNPHPSFSGWEYAGGIVWLVAVTGEAIADRQLTLFKKDPASRGKVCSAGLWNYSRHPNYFFEWLMWVAYFLFAMGSPYGWLAVISPLIILYLLLRVTGIPTTEEQSLRSKGDAYRAYQQTTSVFLPLPKKK